MQIPRHGESWTRGARPFAISHQLSQRASSYFGFRSVLTVTPRKYLRAKIGEDRDARTSEKKCGQYVLLHKALHQQKPDGTSSKHSDNEQDDHYWCETQHGNQSGMRHELSQPPPQRNLAHDSRNEHEGKQTKTEGWMIATWKAGAGFMRITIWFHFSRNTKEVYFG